MAGMTSTTELATSGLGSETILKADKRGRVRFTIQQREDLLSQYDQSGISAAAFAKCSGLKYTTLCGWLHRRLSVSAGGKMHENRRFGNACQIHASFLGKGSCLDRKLDPLISMV
ncbi:MAG: hypothetical protein PHV34_08270, partial [Verrucomicrobiae bacterium]|nr:hypothetical protein [Verrucomicrobiae bacterium]